MYAWKILKVDMAPCSLHMQDMPRCPVGSILTPGKLPVWDILATRAGPTRNGSPSIIVRGLGKKSNISKPSQDGQKLFSEGLGHSSKDETLAVIWAELILH